MELPVTRPRPNSLLSILCRVIMIEVVEVAIIDQHEHVPAVGLTGLSAKVLCGIKS